VVSGNCKKKRKEKEKNVIPKMTSPFSSKGKDGKGRKLQPSAVRLGYGTLPLKGTAAIANPWRKETSPTPSTHGNEGIWFLTACTQEPSSRSRQRRGQTVRGTPAVVWIGKQPAPAARRR